MNKTVTHKSSYFANSHEASAGKAITLDLTPDEIYRLEKYCRQTGKVMTDVIQELIQNLPVN